MTNAELIQAIRNEIEKRIKNKNAFRARGELLELLSFLDTLESEKPSEGLEKEITTWIPAHISGGENGIWKECREAITEWGGIVARHFAEWGAEHLKK